MTDVITVEVRDEMGDRYWLVAVGSDGKTRPIARCEDEALAVFVADALALLPAERLADAEERLAVAAGRRRGGPVYPVRSAVVS